MGNTLRGVWTFNTGVVLTVTSLKPKLDAKGYVLHDTNYLIASRPPMVVVT
jgi:hypothetical protein